MASTFLSKTVAIIQAIAEITVEIKSTWGKSDTPLISLNLVFKNRDETIKNAVTPIASGPTILAAFTGSSLAKIVFTMALNTKKAIMQPTTGESTQLDATFPMTVQSIEDTPPAIMPKPINAPITECVVEIGSSLQVDRVTHNAAARSDATKPSSKV